MCFAHTWKNKSWLFLGGGKKNIGSKSKVYLSPFAVTYGMAPTSIVTQLYLRKKLNWYAYELFYSKLWYLELSADTVMKCPGVQVVGGLGLSWQASFGLLVLLYFYSHYFFASGAAHIGAMFTAFLSVSTALGTPPLFGALVLAFLSNLMGGLTHYGIGSAPVFYGAGYVPLSQWWGYGFLCSVVNIIIWLGIGGVWWKFLGLW